MKKEIWLKWLPYITAIVLFFLFAIIYNAPIFDGKVLQAGDTTSWKGMSHELKTNYEKTGENSSWTGSMFSGMPSYQIGYSDIPSGSWLSPVVKFFRMGLQGPLMYFMCYLIGFFVLLRAFKVNTWISIIGAFAITLSSYFIIILAAGHNTKANTLAWMAPVIAGFFLLFDKKYAWGTILTLIFVSIGLPLHPQMSYYIFMLIGCLYIAELYIHITDKGKKMKDFAIASLLFFLCVGVGIGTQYSKVQLNNEYMSETMRGGHSEIMKDKDETNKTAGLDLDYATQWCYGIDETFTLMIPNFKGASSNYNAGTDSKVFNSLIANNVPRKEAARFATNVPTYWGDQPFTAGPVYVGAIVCFLFVLGLCIVKGPYKWALLVATIFSILLSWGNHFMGFTELFFNYFPMYNKFRAVSSILVVAEITMPLLGFLAIKAIMDKQISKDKIIHSVYIAAGITAGICLIFALGGSLFYDFISPNDEQNLAQLPDWLTESIIAERASMLRNDAFRSMIFILLGASAVWLYVKEKIKLAPFIVTFGVLILADMWLIDKRFLNDDNFVSPKAEMNYFKKMPYEEVLLQDKDPNFRVLNLTTNTFNESRTSYYFKSVGGYHAAKLRRYQDLIENQISKMNMNVLNMLNTKYFIVSTGNNKEPMPQLNPNAYGNAWFVDSLILVNTPNEEMSAMDSANLSHVAVVDVSKFDQYAKEFTPTHDSNATVKLLTYAPSKLEYESSNLKAGTIVFSEVYYPHGWKAFIDNKPAEHFSVNYVLRALNVPAGNHQIKFVFDPDTLHKSEPISFICIFLMYGTILGWIVYYGVRRVRSKKNLSGKTA